MEIKNKFIINYPAIFTPNKPTGHYTIRFPDLGVTLQIEDKGMEYLVKEAEADLCRTVVGIIEKGHFLCEPSPLDEIKPDPDFDEEPNSFVLLLTADAYPFITRSRW